MRDVLGLCNVRDAIIYRGEMGRKTETFIIEKREA